MNFNVKETAVSIYEDLRSQGVTYGDLGQLLAHLQGVIREDLHQRINKAREEQEIGQKLIAEFDQGLNHSSRPVPTDKAYA